MKFKNLDEPFTEPKIKIKKYRPTKLAFNLSFLTNDKNYNLSKLDKMVKAKIIDKMEKLSKEDFVKVINFSKEQGLESIEPKFFKKIRMHNNFKKDRDEFCADNYWIFRLGKSGRVIGKIIDNKYSPTKTFFVLSVDTKFDQYTH